MPLAKTNPSERVEYRREPSSTIDEQRIVTALEANIVEADTIQGSEVSEQRQRNHIHYSLDRLGNETSGRSHHISADVFDSVESQKAFYQEAFTSDRRPLQFQPEHPQDNLHKQATEYVQHQFMNINDGYSFLRDSFHDAMIAKRCVAKVEWSEQYEYVEQPFQGQPEFVLRQLESQPMVTNMEITREDISPQGIPLYSGFIEIEQEKGFADLELVQPERYFRDPNVSFIQEAVFAGYQEDLSRHELIDLGFDEGEVMELNLDYRFRQNEEDAARKAHDSSWSRARRHKRNPEQEIVTVYWHWAYLDMSQYMSEDPGDMGIGGTKLYKFCWSQGRLLTLPETMEYDDEGTMIESEVYVEATDGFPFFEWTQYKIAHSEFGLCEADIQSDIQWNRSNLRRLIIDNQAMGNTSRWKARHGFIRNPRELLDNNIGSILWVKDMEALQPLETPATRPESFALLEELASEKENRSGLSSLAKGLNSDAISHQNSADMIARLTNASNRRVLRGVRDYAETFLKPIMLHIYNLGVRHDKQVHTVEINGQAQQVTPEQWPERSVLKVQVALTPDESREQAIFLTNMHATLSADEDLKTMYGARQKFNLISDIFELLGSTTTQRYMLDPNSPEYQQIQQQQAQQAQQEFQKQEQLLQLQLQLEQRDQNRKDQELKLKEADTASDNLRADDELAHKMWMEREELKLEATQQKSVQIG